MIHFNVGKYRYTYESGEMTPDNPETPADETAQAQNAIDQAWFLLRWSLDYFPYTEAGVAYYLAQVPTTSNVLWIGPPPEPEIPGRIY